MSDDELLFLLDSDVRNSRIRDSKDEKDVEEYKNNFKTWLEVQV